LIGNTMKQEVVRRISLKERLDEIESSIQGEVISGYYQSRLKWLLSLWDNGEAIASDFTGVDSEINYNQLSKETGRSDKSLKKWHILYKQYPDRNNYLPIAEKKAQQWTQKALDGSTAHVSLNSGVSEWYTPTEIIELARNVMGTIDVDPATTSEVNKDTVNAKVFYTAETNGLGKKWKGNVWMNPPYSQPLVSQFCNTFAEKYRGGEIKQGCVLINNATETGFAQILMRECSVVCFPESRMRFLDINGKPGAPLQGQMIIYCGDNTDTFIKEFSCLGVCLRNADK